MHRITSIIQNAITAESLNKEFSINMHSQLDRGFQLGRKSCGRVLVFPFSPLLWLISDSLRSCFEDAYSGEGFCCPVFIEVIISPHCRNPVIDMFAKVLCKSKVTVTVSYTLL